MRQNFHLNTGRARHVLSLPDQPIDSSTFATATAIHRPLGVSITRELVRNAESGAPGDLYALKISEAL